MWAPICPKCREKMSFEYYEKGQQEENESIGQLSDLKHPMLNSMT